jgi:hypothetical protein
MTSSNAYLGGGVGWTHIIDHEARSDVCELVDKSVHLLPAIQHLHDARERGRIILRLPQHRCRVPRTHILQPLTNDLDYLQAVHR